VSAGEAATDADHEHVPGVDEAHPERQRQEAVKKFPYEGRTLYQDITDDKATWVDAVFWMVMGSVLSGGAQALIELAIKQWAGE
jgi:hypothetical protein